MGALRLTLSASQRRAECSTNSADCPYRKQLGPAALTLSHLLEPPCFLLLFLLLYRPLSIHRLMLSIVKSTSMTYGSSAVFESVTSLVEPIASDLIVTPPSVLIAAVTFEPTTAVTSEPITAVTSEMITATS